MGGNKGLGRGLEALFGDKNSRDVKARISQISVEALKPNQNQPRKYFNETALQELANSIKTQGIVQPLLVRPTENEGEFQIIAGERRWRAAKLAGLTELPVLIRNLNDQEVMAAALIENLQREDLNPIEEAEALQSLKETLKLTQEELAERLGKSRPAITNTLRLLQLSKEIQKDLETGQISTGHARCLLSIEDTATREELRNVIRNKKLTVRETEEAVVYWKTMHGLPWDEETGNEKIEKTKRRKKSLTIKNWQDALSEALKCKVTINGTEESGKIGISYTNNEEFTHLLSKMGLQNN